MPNLFLKLFPIVLLAVADIQKTVDKFVKLNVPVKNLISWLPNGNTQPLVNEELGYKIVNFEGLEFHCKTDEDLKYTRQLVEQIKSMKMFYNIPPEKYEEALSNFLMNVMKIKMNWKNPRTWQEKLMWLRLYDSTPLKTLCADKFRVREYVTEKIGAEYLIPLLNVYDNPDDINLDELPDKFVLKCNHGSSFNVIVKDKSKFDFEVAKEKLKGWLMVDFGVILAEFHYCKIPRRIVAEKFIEVKNFQDIPDYKFHCFNGKPVACQFMTGRYTDDFRQTFFDMHWKKLPYALTDHPAHDPDTKFDKPKNYELMIELAKKLSADFSYVRVDFYDVDGRIYFGELTLTPAAGIPHFTPIEYDEIVGDMIKLPKEGKPFNLFA